MKLVEQYDADAGKRPVVLEPAQQDPFGYVTNAGAEGSLIVEANLVADLRAKSHAAFPGDTRCDRARRDPPRLENHDLFCVWSGRWGMRNIRQARIEQHLRHLRCFAGTGRRDEHKTIAGAECFNNLRMDLPDGKGGVHCKRAPTTWTVKQGRWKAALTFVGTLPRLRSYPSP